MTRTVIGWESTEPVPDGYQFNDYLSVKYGRLFLRDVDLPGLFMDEGRIGNVVGPLPSPMEIAYLPKIGEKIAGMREIFAAVKEEIEYAGDFYYAYASKANAAEEVIRTTLRAEAHHEMSSNVDVRIAELMIERGLLRPEKMIIANGFKTAGSAYATSLLRLKAMHDNLIPVIEDLSEIPAFLLSGKRFDVGLRFKCYSANIQAIKDSTVNSRFGLDEESLWKAASYIAAAPDLSLKMFHAMVGGQITDREVFVARLEPTIELYARLRRSYPSLTIFNFGGGMPAAMTLDFEFDYAEFWRLLLTKVKEICGRYQVEVPDIMGEFGRYTTSEHGAHLFKIVTVKDNNAAYPWYIINGSIMSSFPDSWALSEHFIVLPLNHLDQPFQLVKLGGITCDSDDVYPPKNSQTPLYLPIETEELYVGFFSVGAYQEMLGGVRGSKHCVLPEANELLIDQKEDGTYKFELLEGQTTADVLNNLGYKLKK